MTSEIERQVHYLSAIPYDAQNTTGSQNTWNYNRAPEGYLFLLHSIVISCDLQDTTYEGILTMFDGHEYTHWNIWPGVQSQETLARATFNAYMLDRDISLNLWKCKEYTIGVRSRNAEYAFKTNAIVWYYLKKASRMELMEYAIKHPKNQDMFKRIYRGTTVEPSEANG